MSPRQSVPPDRTGLQFDCERCGKPLQKPGALLFSPPRGDRVRKHHICRECYAAMAKQLRP